MDATDFSTAYYPNGDFNRPKPVLEYSRNPKTLKTLTEGQTSKNLLICHKPKMVKWIFIIINRLTNQETSAMTSGVRGERLCRQPCIKSSAFNALFAHPKL